MAVKRSTLASVYVWNGAIFGLASAAQYPIYHGARGNPNGRYVGYGDGWKGSAQETCIALSRLYRLAMWRDTEGTEWIYAHGTFHSQRTRHDSFSLDILRAWFGRAVIGWEGYDAANNITLATNRDRDGRPLASGGK